MKVREVINIIGILVFILVLSSSSYAKTITFKEIGSNKLIENGLIYVYYDDIKINEYIEKEFDLNINEGDAIFIFDYLETNGNDYYRKLDLKEVKNEIILLPVGSLKGEVKDSLDNLVRGSKLGFNCGEGFYFPNQTDNFGSFYVRSMPLGECRICAIMNDAVGCSNVLMEKGDLKNLEIKLDKTVIGEDKDNSFIFWIFLFLIVLFVVLGYFIYLRKSSLVKDKKLLEEVKEDKVNKRTDDIVKTLNEKEKVVVSFLMENGKQLPQSTIRHNTGVPRTSLTRILNSLEAKKVVKLEKFGKLVKVKLTDWFLGKD